MAEWNDTKRKEIGEAMVLQFQKRNGRPPKKGEENRFLGWLKDKWDALKGDDRSIKEVVSDAIEMFRGQDEKPTIASEFAGPALYQEAAHNQSLAAGELESVEEPEEGAKEAPRTLEYDQALSEEKNVEDVLIQRTGGDNMSDTGEGNGMIAPLQEALVSTGYDVGPDGIDGWYGEDTEAAVKKFQEDAGLEPTGVVDGELYRRIVNGRDS